MEQKMNDQQLVINIIPFLHPEEKKEFQFVKEKKEGFYPLRNYKLPANANEILTDEEIQEEIPLYTNFIDNIEGDLALSVSFKDSPEFAKHYYNTRIFNYFKLKEHIVRFNFVNDIELWFKAKDKPSTNCQYYHKLALRVQFNKVTDKPELLVYYAGKSRTLLKSIQ